MDIDSGPVFAQRVLSNWLATHQREKVPMVSRARAVAADALQMLPQVGNTAYYITKNLFCYRKYTDKEF